MSFNKLETPAVPLKDVSYSDLEYATSSGEWSVVAYYESNGAVHSRFGETGVAMPHVRYVLGLAERACAGTEEVSS